MREISYVMVKPGFANFQAIIDEVKQRIIETGLEISDEAFVQYTKEDVQNHYSEHLKRADYKELEKFILSDKVYGMKVEGENAIKEVRAIMGEAKNPAPGTIRHDIPEALGIILPPTQNVTHASDSVKAAEKELGIFYDILSRSERTKE